jgi:Na+/melibiose symporter-like transporter
VESGVIISFITDLSYRRRAHRTTLAGTVILISKIYDSITTLSGLLADHTHQTRRRRPYLLLGILLIFLSFFVYYPYQMESETMRFVAGVLFIFSTGQHRDA